MAMKALLCSLTVVVATGCTNVSGGSLQTPRPTTSAPTTATANAARSPDTSLTLTCRLPVNSPTYPGDPRGGWITFPGGKFERDPASLPIRLQSHVPSYDRAIKAWVPVEYRYVAPSGASYVLTQDQSLPDPSAFYLVDVKTGTRRRILAGDGPPQASGSWT